MYISSFIQQREKPIKVVPRVIIVLLLACLFLQVSWHALRPSPLAHATELPFPPSAQSFLPLSLGEPESLSRLLMLWLQAFDNQPGISIPFKELDYDKVIAWLNVILELDNRMHYPLLSASRLYSEVPDETKKRMMLEFVYLKFLEDPDTRWKWLAQCVYVAKHRIKDLALALRYSSAIRQHATAAHVPSWAKQMELFVLDEMGDTEAAKVILGGLLESGAIKDKNELAFLKDRLDVE